MIEPLLISSSLLFGKEVVTQTITSTTKNIYLGIDNILLNDNQQFKQILEDLDIKIKLDIISSFIDELHQTKKIFNEPINKTFKYLDDILKTIEKEIENINIEIKNHKNKWFHKLRSSNCSSMLGNLIKHKKILDERFELLIKLINI